MAKFRKKPVVIEAVQWTGENVKEVVDFGGPFVVSLAGVDIKTLEGTMRADRGDWIIKGVKGEFYPIKDEIFRATYEPVD